ncbi:MULTISPECIES: ribbon-helix-helix protein, CopG family [Vibrio]|uniref:ribbon-helix-helix protein, CopG family n=1 Tax=Vibrio TaxID=662 RepID=UPI0002D4F9B0|nr:ribbon-helix-helix protein, CopG family [Vibrio genomosp. F10]
MSKPRITIRFDEEVFAEIQKLAEEQDRSINWLVNRLLADSLNTTDDTKNSEA